jgi:hypothetical protein
MFALDNTDTAHLKELLKKEMELRREAERTNKELRDNFLRLTHLMLQKQTIEGDLLTRLISLENEVIGLEAGNTLSLHSLQSSYPIQMIRFDSIQFKSNDSIRFNSIQFK